MGVPRSNLPVYRYVLKVLKGLAPGLGPLGKLFHYS